MRKSLLLLLLLSSPLHAQNWSIGVGTGPFIFGDFVRRTMTVSNEGGSERQTVTLSAAKRAGLTVDLSRHLSNRFDVRFESSFTHSRLGIKGLSNTVALDAGAIDVTTLSVPLVFNVNRNGTFRFHLMAGPAYASYRITNRTNAAQTIRSFRGTRSDWGPALGGGIAWQVRPRFAIEGRIADVTTKSPFHRSDVSGLGAYKFPRTHNVHTTIGLRYDF